MRFSNPGIKVSTEWNAKPALPHKATYSHGEIPQITSPHKEERDKAKLHLKVTQEATVSWKLAMAVLKWTSRAVKSNLKKKWIQMKEVREFNAVNTYSIKRVNKCFATEVLIYSNTYDRIIFPLRYHTGSSNEAYTYLMFPNSTEEIIQHLCPPLQLQIASTITTY